MPVLPTNWFSNSLIWSSIVAPITLLVASVAAGQDAHKAEFDKQVTDGWIKVYEEPTEEPSADSSDVSDDMDL